MVRRIINNNLESCHGATVQDFECILIFLQLHSDCGNACFSGDMDNIE